MWVVFNEDSGWSDESMRFATPREAREYIADHPDLNLGKRFEADA